MPAQLFKQPGVFELFDVQLKSFLPGNSFTVFAVLWAFEFLTSQASLWCHITCLQLAYNLSTLFRNVMPTRCYKSRRHTTAVAINMLVHCINWTHFKKHNYCRALEFFFCLSISLSLSLCSGPSGQASCSMHQSHPFSPFSIWMSKDKRHGQACKNENNAVNTNTKNLSQKILPCWAMKFLFTIDFSRIHRPPGLRPRTAPPWQRSGNGGPWGPSKSFPVSVFRRIS